MELALDSMGAAVRILADPTVLLFLAIGVVWGSVCGVLPGAGSGVAIGVMVPLTFGMNAVTAVTMLVSISVAVSFGNGLPATLLGIPTSPASIFTALDGYAITRRGQGGLAVALNWFAVVWGQLISIPFFLVLVVPLSTLTYTFLAPEMFALYCLGMAALVSLAGENILKGLAAAAVGLTIAFIGADPVSAVPRFTFGIPELRGGVQSIPAVLGLVTISELIRNMRQVFGWDDLAVSSQFSPKFPGLGKLVPRLRSILPGALIGTLVGAVPGLSGSAAAVIAYNQAKLTSKTPEEFGKGSAEGLTANEAAQNAAQAGEMVPTLALGIPGSDSMVLILGALMLQGFVPGPRMMQESPELLHATVAGLLGGALLLLLLGWRLAKLMLKATQFDRRIVLPLAFLITHVGVFALRRSFFDVFVMLVCGFIGYLMVRYGYSTAAAGVALILGAGFEANLRQGLLLMDSSIVAFVTRPWTGVILSVAIGLLLYGSYSTIKMSRRARAIAALNAQVTAPSR